MATLSAESRRISLHPQADLHIGPNFANFPLNRGFSPNSASAAEVAQG